MKDLTNPTKVFKVSTQRHDVAYYATMGEDILVNAKDANDACEVAKAKGYDPNPYFPPVEVHK